MRHKRSVIFVLLVVFSGIGMGAGLILRNYVESIPKLSELSQFEHRWQALASRAASVADWHDKTILLNFWGSWCPPCVAEMPLLDRFNDEYGEEDFQVVGMALDDRDAAEQFYRDNEIRFLSVHLDVGVFDDIMALYKQDNPALPITLIFTSDGSVSQVKLGPFDEAELDAIITDVAKL